MDYGAAYEYRPCGLREKCIRGCSGILGEQGKSKAEADRIRQAGPGRTCKRNCWKKYGWVHCFDDGDSQSEWTFASGNASKSSLINFAWVFSSHETLGSAGCLPGSACRGPRIQKPCRFFRK